MEFSTVLEHLKLHFNVHGELSALGSCEDLNFKLKCSSSVLNPSFTAGKYVVKYIRAGVDDTVESHIKVQHQVMRHIQSANLPYRCPLPMTCADGNETTVKINANSIDYIMHVLSYQDGNLLSEQKYFSPHLLESFGKMIAILSDCMSTSDVKTDRKTQWDMQTAFELIQSYASCVEDATRRVKVVAMSNEMNAIISSHRGHLRTQLVHADLAPYNVLVHAKERNDGQPLLDAIIDFGDVSESWLVAEIAIALTPLLVPAEGEVTQKDSFSDDHHPLRTTLLVLRGFLKTTPLNRDEAVALWPLIVLRATLLNLAVAKLLETDPDNDYLRNEIVQNEKMVEAVLSVPAASAIKAIVEICGFDSVDATSSNVKLTAPVTVTNASSYATLDLSCYSTSFEHSGEWKEEKNVQTYVQRLAEVGAVTHVGVPWLIRCTSNTPQSPLSYPTFTALTPIASNIHVSFASNCEVHLDHYLALEDPLFHEVFAAITGQEYVGEQATILLCAIREVIVTADDGNWSARYLFVHDKESPSGVSSSVGQKYSAGSPVNMDGQNASMVLVQVLQLRSFAFTSLLNHPDLYQPLHRTKDNTNTCQCFPPLFVTHFDWKYLWRPLLIDPMQASEADKYEAIREEAMFSRNEYLGSLQEHYYDIDDLSLLPPLILRGDRAHLIAHTGRPLLDMVNNVAVVGHSHPAVEKAAMAQLSFLNTNSRFIYPGLGAFAQEIIHKTVPEHARHQLNRVVFVNSGSEATDLALRVARTVVSHRRWHAQKQLQGEEVAFRWFRDVICLRGGYHGVTTASDEVSTTLNDNPLALQTRPDHVHLAPMPNFFRGLYTRDNTLVVTSTEHQQNNHALQVDLTSEEESTLATKYAEHVQRMVSELLAQDRAPTAFIAEPLSGNAGGVCLPHSYLQKVYATLRQPSVGALCICDEVQTGYGRLGQGFWGFLSKEHESLLPDIITVAKAAGNGHPLGYIVTSQSILDEFYAAQGSFFSSAGGGPVSCAIGRAVLKTVQEEQLMKHAAEVGDVLAVGLRALQKKHPHVIGYIHGYGLYQGVEIIAWDQGEDGNGKKAGTKEARLICRRLLDLGIVCHNTGDYSNVLKVKPPLCFSKDDAEYFMAMLDKICTEGW